MTNLGEPVSIEIDRKPVLWSLIWSWILIFIPTALYALRLAGLSYTLTDDSIIIRTGLMSKKTEHVELYRVRNVSTASSAFSGGKVVLAMQDGTTHTIAPIQDADATGTRIRAAVNSARSSRNVQNREDL